MEVVLTFVKNYFVLMLIFYLLSYLTPKETYQKYFHFFVSVLVITVLAQPFLVYVGGMKKDDGTTGYHAVLEMLYTDCRADGKHRISGEGREYF